MSYVFSNTEAKSNQPVAKTRIIKKRKKEKTKELFLDSWESDLVDFN